MTSTEAPLVHLSLSPEKTSALTGLCWPGAPDSEVDELQVKSILGRRDRMAEAFAETRLDAGLADFVRGLSNAHAMSALRVFDGAWAAAMFRQRPRHIIDDAPFEPDLADRVRWALACAAEQDGAPGGVIVPPPLGAALQYLYFPDSHVLLYVGDGPVAILRQEQRIRVTNGDGRCFTLPRGPGAIPTGVHARGPLLALDHAGPWPLLNGIPFFGEFVPGTPASPEEARKGRSVITEGLQLLDAVWPALKAFAERWLRGVLVLKYPGYSRSHTSVHAPQVLMCSTESAVKVGEAICHELSHARMFILLENDTILNDDYAPIHRSVWRRDGRPLIGVVNGVHAFLNVCRYYERLKKVDATRWGKEADTVLKVQRPKIAEAWSYIQQHAVWTESGARVAHSLDTAVQELCE
jgi:HEXXH motif-containing protein